MALLMVNSFGVAKFIFQILSVPEIIGRGNFGVVHKAILKRNSAEKIVAVKSLTGYFFMGL